MALINKREIQRFQRAVLQWFRVKGRSFPWRDEGLNDYQLIIAEVLLQRTKAETVAKFYPKFIEDFPDWQSLTMADIKEIESTLKPIGLYKQRASRLISLAREMFKRKGKIPSKREELENIPFMGQYISNAVQLIIQNKRLPLIDVNMSRVLERYFKERELVDIRYDPYLQDLARKIVDHVDAKEMNWAILDFASLICKARNPACNNCMLAVNCTFYKTR